MEIRIIRTPLVFPSHHTTSVTAVPDVGTAYINGSLRKLGHNSKVIDAPAEALNRWTQLEASHFEYNGLSPEEILDLIPPNIGLIGVSCMHSHRWLNDQRIIKALFERFPSTPIVLGGEHITANFSAALHQFPKLLACVLGEGEETIGQLVHALQHKYALETIHGIAYINQAGHLVQTPTRDRMNDLDQLSPSWEGVPLENYLKLRKGINSLSKRALPILTSRGCPFSCHFCTCKSMWQSRWISRTPENVIEEIKRYIRDYKIEHVDLVDLTLGIGKNQLLNFARALADAHLPITWAVPIGTRVEGLDENILGIFSESGLARILFNPESGSNRTLAAIDKQLDLRSVISSVRGCVKAGICVKAAFVFGFPEQTKRDVLKTLLFIVKLAFLGANDVVCQGFVPYPGTQLYNQIMPHYDYTNPDKTIGINSDIPRLKSWTSHYSANFLRISIVGCMATFYLIQFVLRPHRLLSALHRIFITNKPLTNLESMIFLKLHKNSAP